VWNARHADRDLGGTTLPLPDPGEIAEQRQSDRGERLGSARQETTQAVAPLAHLGLRP